MRQSVVVAFGLLLLLSPATQVFAQEEGGSVSWFSQFLWADDFLGVVIIWALLAMSAFSIGFSTNLLIQYRRKKVMPEEVLKRIEVQLGNRQYRAAITEADNNNSYLSKIVAAALHEAPNGFAAMERAIEETSDNETVKILRPLEYLNVLGNIAPMIGLFGTVYGMIRAFQQLVVSGGNADPSELAAGISTALITTFWGLVVAVPALASYALIRNKVDTFASEAILAVESLIAPFKPTPLAAQQARAAQMQQQQAAQTQAQAQMQSQVDAGQVAQQQQQVQPVAMQPNPQMQQQQPVNPQPVQPTQPMPANPQPVMPQPQAMPQQQPMQPNPQAQPNPMMDATQQLSDAANQQPDVSHRMASSPLLSAAAQHQQQLQQRKDKP
ncbi:MotA/TolQ/ExbB proton channel family protein [Planctomycetota bacterium]|nr:MotA/TolQ/ExbB proton channel family protein [Planctomycetota bacterium]